jgi:hypothetical protein
LEPGFAGTDLVTGRRRGLKKRSRRSANGVATSASAKRKNGAASIRPGSTATPSCPGIADPARDSAHI